MLKKPVQILRIFTLLIVAFVGFQLFQVVKLKNDEISYSEVAYKISQQQFIFQKITFALEKYRGEASDENLIALNSLISLFGQNQKFLVKQLVQFDLDQYVISAQLNDQILKFINETERLKSSNFEFTSDYRSLVGHTLPNEYHRLLNGLLLQNELDGERIERKVILLIVSLFALLLQSFLLIFFERELKV